jgi:TetR/AcrR family transcriptional repressor of uid operon
MANTYRKGRPVDLEGRAARRKEIMAAARGCFLRKGFHAASTAEISERASISVAGLYQYFPTKADLVLALVEEDLEMDLEWVGVLAKAESLQIGLTRLALEYANDVGCGDAVRLRLEITAEASRDPKIATVFTDVETRLVTAVSHLLADRQAKGEIDLALDPEVAARTVLAFLDGLFGWIAVGGASQENEAFVRAALELMWRGLKPAAP